MTRAVGVDISVYDSTFNPTNFVKFVIMRRSFGTYYGEIRADLSFDKYYPESLTLPVRGAYHYLSSHSNWKAQADKFLSLVDGKDIDFFACDVESYYNTVDKNFIAMAMEWMNYVRNITKKKVLLYTNLSIYNTVINLYDKDRASQYDLWLAMYYYDYSNYLNVIPRLPSGRLDWSIWQFIPGEWGKFGYEAGVGRDGVDTNVYNGTIEEMMKWCNAGGGIPPTPPPSTYPIQANVTAYALNIRSKPMIPSETVGGLKRGATIFILDIQKDSEGNDWGKLGEKQFIALKYKGQYYTTWRG